MKTIALSVVMFGLCFFGLAGNARAAEACKLKTYASSWMDTGTPFAVHCASGDYTGTLISTPSKRFFRRGHLVLKFDQPVAASPKENGEGIFQPGRGKQISSMLLAGGAGIGSKDLFDGAIAAGGSKYLIPATCVILAFFMKGGDVNLKPGFQLYIQQTPTELKNAPASGGH